LDLASTPRRRAAPTSASAAAGPGAATSSAADPRGPLSDPCAKNAPRHAAAASQLPQLVGGSRETVNKVLSEFASRGWLRLGTRTVVLLDLPRLAQRARAAGS
jgi:CRP-like cAMP-binding protein